MNLASFAARPVLAAGGFAALVAAPIAAALLGGPSATPLASCPQGEELDPTSGACRPVTDLPAPTMNPINPENAPLQPGSITSSSPGEVGRLPEVNGIPCTGENTGLCIGLSEENKSLESRPNAPVIGVTP